jgi:hypothetical protein
MEKCITLNKQSTTEFLNIILHTTIEANLRGFDLLSFIQLIKTNEKVKGS